MAKRSQRQWKQKGIYYPNAQQHKGRFIPQDRKRKKQKQANVSNYMGYNKPKIAKPIKRDNKSQLTEFARETRKNRIRSERPERFDKLVDNWHNTPKSIRLMYVNETAKYYESEEVQDMIRRRKQASGTYKSPVDSKYYIKHVKPYLDNIRLNKDEQKEITMKTEDEFQHAARNWLSNRISPEEFEQSFKTFEQGEELIKLLYENSKYVNTSVTLEDYNSAFYSVFRNALQKSKSQYDSNTIRTYLLSNGIDEYNDGDDLTEKITPERLDEIAAAINPKIGLVIADINQLNALMAGNEPTVKRRKAIDIKPKTKKVGDDKTWFDDKDVMQYFKGYRLGDMKVDELEYLSEILPTKGELIKAQKLLARAKRKMNANFKHETVDLYERAASVIEDKGNTLGIDDLTNELVDEINAMELLKNRGQWNN